MCQFNALRQSGVYTLSHGDDMVRHAPPGGAGGGECGMGENEIKSSRDSGAVCEPGETLGEIGNAQIRCTQNRLCMNALTCALDEVCRHG